MSESVSPDGVTIEGDWRAYAACREGDPDLFFPAGTTGSAVKLIESAKAICAECDVNAPCLDFALATNQDSGVWGGTDESERRKLRRQWLAQKRRALGPLATTSVVTVSLPLEQADSADNVRDSRN
jgi:WhiB family redox-sensing transcriptional regulator